MTLLENVMVAGYSMDGQIIEFVTYLGSDNTDTGYDIGVSGDGTLHIGGRTELTATFPVTDQALQSEFGGGFSDSFVVRLLPNVRLRGSVANGQLVLSWPQTKAGLHLQSAVAIVEPIVWADFAQSPVLADGRWTLTIDPTDAVRFFRLLDRD